MAVIMNVIRGGIFRIETRVLQALGIQNSHGWPQLGFDFASAEREVQAPKKSNFRDVLDNIFGNGILWAAVPKHRRSLERRMIRRMGEDKIRKHLTPKKNIVECLECGHWHEAHTICGNCYDKVRKETEFMQKSMPENERLANIPQTEVVYLYEDERDQRTRHSEKFVVEVEKPRPEWWPRNLLTKGQRG